MGEHRGETPPAAVTVDELLEAPERVAELTPAEATRLVARLAALTPALVIRITERQPEPPAAPAHDELLMVPAVATRLKMTHREVYALVTSGALPKVETGSSRIRIASSAVDEWIRGRSSGEIPRRPSNLGDLARVK